MTTKREWQQQVLKQNAVLKWKIFFFPIQLNWIHCRLNRVEPGTALSAIFTRTFQINNVTFVFALIPNQQRLYAMLVQDKREI